MSNATLSFLPWARQGAASAITTTDSLGAQQSAITNVTPTLSLNSQIVPALSVRLRGPADVIGIDTNQVIRTDPVAGSNDFEPNCFAAVELDRADFPWLFTPAKANTDSRLRPWLCLVVVQAQPGVTVTTDPDAPLPALQVASPANPAVELPDLTESWAWAHAQASANDNSQPQIASALNGAPELSLSRLVCPRILTADTDYLACVVPTFELGRKAGLGLDISDADQTAANALAPAWALTPTPPTQVTVPVYYQWTFRTGRGGDFESLARQLQPNVPQGLGTRPVDISHPGFPVSGVTTANLEGALLPVLPAGSAPEPDPIPAAYKTSLAAIVNPPAATQASTPNTDPLLAPPLYGRWHAAQTSVSPAATTWLDQLNLDPRWRVAAAFGTQVIQQNQAALMASAWDQAAQLAAANQRLRQLQLSLAVSTVIHNKHLAPMSEDLALRVTAPAFARLRNTNGTTLLSQQLNSILPVDANRSAMRRIGRQRGPLTRRIASQNVARSLTSWVSIMNSDGQGTSAPPPPPPAPPEVLATFHSTVTFSQGIGTSSYYGAFFVAPEGAPVTAPGVPVLKNTTEIPGFFRAAAIAHLNTVFPNHPIQIQPHFVIFPDILPTVLQQMQPATALRNLANAVISTGSTVLAPTAPGVTPTGVESVMAAPTFTQPMYEPLRELSQDLLLPGLETVAPNTVLGLTTNRRFVEAYMVGLNHEMGRELLWRGFPTDQRGTYFSHFWGLGVPNSASVDIEDLNTWGTRSLGDAAGAPSAEEFVMLLRSSLLQRYPNALIYLTPALGTGSTLTPDLTPANEKQPLFTGSMQPDVSFFGFPVTVPAAVGGTAGDGGPGHYVIVEEHPTEPRFGLDAELSLGSASHLSIGTAAPAGIPIPSGCTWGKNSAHMAGITRRLPVRMAIHASRLIVAAQNGPAKS